MRLRGKKFTPQVSRDELLARTSDALRKYGVDHHSQAVFMSAIGKEVLNSDNPLFTSIHPHPKYRDNLAWKRSYAIALKFLEENHMDLTIDMIKSEYPDFSESLFGNTNFIRKLTLTQFLSDKIKKNTSIGFNKRVSAFIQGKKPTRPSYAPPPTVKPIIPKEQSQQRSKTPSKTTTGSKNTILQSELKPFPKPQKSSTPSKQQQNTKSSPKTKTQSKNQMITNTPSSQSKTEKFKEEKNLAPLDVNQTFKKPSIRDLKNAPSPKTNFSSADFNYTDSTPRGDKGNDSNSGIAVDDDFEVEDVDFIDESSKSNKQDNNKSYDKTNSTSNKESEITDDFEVVSETHGSEHNDTVGDDFDEGSESGTSKSQSQAHKSETDDFIESESKAQTSSEAKKSELDNDDFDEASESGTSKSQSQAHQSETDEFIEVESKTQTSSELKNSDNNDDDFIDVESKTQTSSEAKKSDFDNDDFDEVSGSEASKSQSQTHQSETDEFIEVESKTQTSSELKNETSVSGRDSDDNDFIDVDDEPSTKKDSDGSMIEVINEDEYSNIHSNSNATSTIEDSSIAIQSTIKSEISDYESNVQKESDIEIEFENDSKSDINVTIEDFDD